MFNHETYSIHWFIDTQISLPEFQPYWFTFYHFLSVHLVIRGHHRRKNTLKNMLIMTYESVEGQDCYK